MHELEITPSQVARLVLGYLKSEKCEGAHEQFLKTSKHFKEYKGKIITRVDHKTLVDYLTEYSQLNILIQERIEETNFYNEQPSRATLLDQLVYLLDNGANIRASTPNRSPIHRRLALSDVAVNTDFSDKENQECEPNATPLHTLPGNSGSESNKKEKQGENLSSGNHEEEEENKAPTINLEVLTQTLLEHHELHEKLADTINDVRNAPEPPSLSNDSSTTDKNNTAAQDVEAAIKAIVQKATSDPFFDKLVKEVIGEDEESSGGDLATAGHEQHCDINNKCSTNSSPSIKNNGAAPNENNQQSLENATKDADCSLDRYLKFNTKASAANVETQNSLVVNSSNVLMLQQAPAVGTIDITKPYYVINSTAPPICSTGAVLSEQDIMSMPIVVCEDSKQEKPAMSQLIIPTNVPQPVAPAYFVNLAANTQISNSSVQFRHTERVKKPIATGRISKRKIVPKSIPKIETIKVIIEQQQIENKTQQQANQQSVPNIVTPSNDQQMESEKNVPTPRSGSHVRALDFSTPQKLFETSSAAVDPAPTTAKTKDSESDNDKNKCATESLFKQTKSSSGSWDSDLRGLVGTQTKSSPEVPRKKVASKKKRKSTKKSLNATAEEGRQIEKALFGATPQKKTPTKRAESCKKQKQKKSVRKKIKGASPTGDVKTVEDAGGVLTLSPSKLNASRRTLVDLTDTTPEDAERTTPESLPVKNMNAISSVKRNITAALQTPMKTNECPKTPGFFSPVTSSDTPFTKVLKEQLHGIDISTIPTPKFPVTPSFPFTPTIESTRYPNRPTDYSSSSSYYHPSDNENNKSIEQLIEECNRLEGKTEQAPAKKEIPLEKQIHILNEIRIPPAPVDRLVAEKMKTMSRNVIGRKNLQLVEQVVEVVATSSSSGSSDSSSDESEGSDDKWSSANKTVVANQGAAQRYSLRLRQNAEKKTTVVENNVESITSILKSVDVKSTLDLVAPAKTHDEILLEMEEKRRKTIEKLERDAQKNKKMSSSRGVKRQPARGSRVQKGRQRRGAVKTKTKPEREELVLSSDLEPFEMVETEMLENSISSTPIERTKADDTSAAAPVEEKIESEQKVFVVKADKPTRNEQQQDVVHFEDFEMEITRNIISKKRQEGEDTSVLTVDRKTGKVRDVQIKATKAIQDDGANKGGAVSSTTRSAFDQANDKTKTENVSGQDQTVESRSEKDVLREKEKTKAEQDHGDVVNASNCNFKESEKVKTEGTGEMPLVQSLKSKSPQKDRQRRKAVKPVKQKQSEEGVQTVKDRLKESENVEVKDNLPVHIVNEKTVENSAHKENEENTLHPVSTAKTKKEATSEGSSIVEKEAKAQEVKTVKSCGSKENDEAPCFGSDNPEEFEMVMTKMVEKSMSTQSALELKAKHSLLIEQPRQSEQENKQKSEPEKLNKLKQDEEKNLKTSTQTLVGTLPKSEKTEIEVADKKTENKQKTKAFKPGKEKVSLKQTIASPLINKEEKKDKQKTSEGKVQETTHTHLSFNQNTLDEKTKTQKTVLLKQSPTEQKSNAIKSDTPQDEDSTVNSNLDEIQDKTKIESNVIVEQPAIVTKETETHQKTQSDSIKKNQPKHEEDLKLVDDLGSSSVQSATNETTETAKTATSEATKPKSVKEDKHKLKVVKTERNSKPTNDKTTEKEKQSDQDAEKMVNDLKERGIHLVHNKLPSKSKGAKQENGQTESETEQSAPVEKIEAPVDVNQFDFLETEFGVCLNRKETVSLVYDPNRPSNKKLSDYDFTLLNKQMNATVYLAEFDAEVQKVMTCTPFESLLDIPSKIGDAVPKKRHSSVGKHAKKEMPKIQKFSPLEMLNRQLSRGQTPTNKASPLEGLYEDEKNSGYPKRTEEAAAQKPKHSKHKRARSLSSSHKELDSKRNASIRSRRSSEPRPTRESVCPEDDEVKGAGGVVSNSNKEDEEDDLMNYASIGTPEKSSKKRKADEKLEGERVDKKIKAECQQLLKQIDVDFFLKQLHGDS